MSAATTAVRLIRSLLIQLWVLPATLLVHLLYIVPLKVAKYIEYVGTIQSEAIPPVAVYRVNPEKNNWYTRMWKDWAGWAGPFVIITKDDVSAHGYKLISYKLTTTIHHEYRHCQQWAWFGIFAYPLYLLASLYIFLFKKDKHAYLDNPFERDARRYAGQKVDIPADQWYHGPNDRWPWWN